MYAVAPSDQQLIVDGRLLEGEAETTLAELKLYPDCTIHLMVIMGVTLLLPHPLCQYHYCYLLVQPLVVPFTNLSYNFS